MYIYMMKEYIRHSAAPFGYTCPICSRFTLSRRDSFDSIRYVTTVEFLYFVHIVDTYVYTYNAYIKGAHV